MAAISQSLQKNLIFRLSPPKVSASPRDLPLRKIGKAWWVPVLFLLATTMAVRAGDYTYTTNSDNTLTITKYTGPGGDVVIPLVIDGRTVTHIGPYAFATGFIFPANTNMTSVTIPDSITHLLSSAFDSSYVLTNVTFGTGLTSIGDSAFWGCTNLTGITIPDGVTNIGNAAFDWCSRLANVILPNGSIGYYAFANCGSLTNVTIGAGVTSIGDNAFTDNQSLTMIMVDAGNTVYSDLNGVLFNKNQTTLVAYPAGKGASYTIPDSATSIGNNAFEYCFSLASINIPDSITRIGDLAFYYCTGLTSVTIPDSVTSIGYLAFFSCESLTSVIVGNSVTNIERQVFRACDSLIGAYFKGNAPSIGEDVFASADIVTIYYLPGTTGWGLTFDGRPTMPWWDGLQISANGRSEDVSLNSSDAVTISVALDAGNYAGASVDWWVLVRANANTSRGYFYLNSSRQWIQFDGSFSNCHPVYQGGLFDLPATEVLNARGLQPGSYSFWFVIDYPMDGVLNLGGYILIDSVNVTVQ